MKIKYILILATTLLLANACSGESDTPPADTLGNGLIIKALLDGDGRDSSGNGNAGDIIGDVPPTGDRNGLASSAMSFEESKGYIDFGNIKELEIGYEDAITASVWIKHDGAQLEWDTILNQFFRAAGPSAEGRFYLGINPYNKKASWRVFGNILESAIAIPDGEWTHIVVDYKDKKMSMYINGYPSSKIDLDDSQHGLGSGAPFQIGRMSMATDTTSGFNGSIDDVYIYDRILDQMEIDHLSQR